MIFGCGLRLLLWLVVQVVVVWLMMLLLLHVLMILRWILPRWMVLILSAGLVRLLISSVGPGRSGNVGERFRLPPTCTITSFTFLAV